MAVRTWLLGGIFLASAAGCSGASTDSKPQSAAGSGGGGDASQGGQVGKGGANSSTSTSLDDYPTAYATALCRVFERCWTAFTDGVGDDCVAYLEKVARAGRFNRVRDAVNEGRLSYQPEALSACVAALEQASCADVDLLACSDLVIGQKQAGESCELDEECAGDTQCLVQSSCPGSCGPRAKLGEACSEFNECERGLSCAEDALGDGSCVETAQLGEMCGSLRPCAGLLRCEGLDRSTPLPTGTCRSNVVPHDGEEGAACDGLGATLCRPGLVCTFLQEDGQTVGRCQPSATSGGACTFSTPSPCPKGEYCHIETALGVKPPTGTCKATPKLGETCRYGTIHVAPCALDQECHPETNVCVQGKQLGEACTVDEECFSGDCDAGGQCVAYLECESAAAE
jgi:hypothetical protein